jgi:cytidylate kinase
MPLIAMTREMGSLGMDVARILESELKVPLVYHELINNLADKMRLRKSHVIRLLGGKANLFERLTADKTSLSIYTADEMLQVARSGAVMRGWGAAHLLRPVKHAICVRICAPFDVRVKRMMERLNTDDASSVATEIRNSDEAQGAIARRHFGVEWQDPEGYDLSLNTERMTVEQCAEEIIQLCEQPEFQETEESRRTLSDLALQANVRAALRADPTTRGLTFAVDSDGAKVRMRGIVGTREESNSAARVVMAVPGVISVKNDLRVTADIRQPMGE